MCQHAEDGQDHTASILGTRSAEVQVTILGKLGATDAPEVTKEVKKEKKDQASEENQPDVGCNML